MVVDIVSPFEVKKWVHTLKQVVEKMEEKKSKPSLFEETYKVNLMFATQKVILSKMIIRIKLPHLLSKNQSVCLFIKENDEKSMRNVLLSKGIDFISEKLKTEYIPYEAKRKLSTSFDIFLADDFILHALPMYLGKAFYGRKKMPVAVHVNSKNLKRHFEKAAFNARCVISGRGSVGMVTVGDGSMSEDQLVENIVAVVIQLATALPGGAANIHRLHIKTENSMALPIFSSSISANDVHLEKEPQSPPSEAEEVTTIHNALVRVTKSGNVKLIDPHTKKVIQPKKGKSVKRLRKVRNKPV